MAYIVYFLFFAKKYKNAVWGHEYLNRHFPYKNDGGVFVPVIIHFKDVLFPFY